MGTSIWKDYGLGIILCVLFIAAWIMQTCAGWYEFKAEQLSHQSPAELWGDSGYVWVWTKATMENWQSEFLQLLCFVVLTKFFVFKGSPESKDSDEEIMAKLNEIDEGIKRLEKVKGGRDI